MNRFFQTAFALSALCLAAQASAQITLYEGEGFRGRAYSSAAAVRDFGRTGFNDRSSSIVVDNGRWEVCEDSNFQGRCMILRRGSYDSLLRLGMENRISSVRPAGRRGAPDQEIQAEQDAPNYAYRRRYNERVFEAPVTSVRAVMAQATQKCWVERQQAMEPGRDSGSNVGGAIAGALIGGVLGHQVGGGSGRDIATVGGAVAGAAIGNNMGNRNDAVAGPTRDVRRCENQAASQQPEYYDVTYNFRGRQHSLQMSAPPGATIAVNGRGEPRQ